MAASDWQILDGSAVHGPTLAAGVTAGLPAATGMFTFVARSMTSSPAVHARRVVEAGFAPCVAGRVSTALLRRGSAGASPHVFLALQGDHVSALCYRLELDVEGRLALVKGALSGGGQVLARGSDVHDIGSWVHVRVEAVDNANGDVLLNVYENDLGANAPDAPVWTSVPGIERFVDDVTAINSGSLPLVGGYLGWGTRLSGSGDYAQLGLLAATRQD